MCKRANRWRLEETSNREAGARGWSLYVEPVADITDQESRRPPGLTRCSPGHDRDVTIASCSSCHQMASARVREYAAKIDAVSTGQPGDATALEAWRKVVRHESWRTIVKYMRAKHFAVFHSKAQ